MKRPSVHWLAALGCTLALAACAAHPASTPHFAPTAQSSQSSQSSQPAQSSQQTQPSQLAQSSQYIRWLEERSMLHQAALLARHYSGSSDQWQHPYGRPQPRKATARASVWFTSYPASIIPAKPGESVLSTLGDERLWRAFQRIGIQAIHTGPMKLSGGIRQYTYTPTVDGHFDRISFEIDPAFGTEAQYKAMVSAAHRHGAIVIGDIIPGHTGKGPDWRLAERDYADYPGLYHMVRIDPKDWHLLPPVLPGHDSVNLEPPTVDALQARGYIVGRLSSRIFFQPGVKDSNWSATGVVRGADGVERRWVYLHYFKEGQPTLNWLDPSFAAERLVVGDAVDELGVLGDSGLRLDANGLLGIEREANGHVWSEGHPLSVTANQLIASMVRKLGGFTFEELALAFDRIHAESLGGPDLSYDFVTRPAYDDALAMGDASLLRLVIKLMRQYDIDPGRLVHALQNHDELTLGLAHFGAHASERFEFRGRQMTGRAVQETVRREMYAHLMGKAAPYNLKFGDGIASTTATIITAVLGIRDLAHLTHAEIERVKRLHLLLAFYNAMQPGVFALSGWDLVGALTLPPESVHARLADGDTRWINRGAYDLLGTNPDAQRSPAGLPRAIALYGPLPAQLRDPSSFASQLAHMLAARARLKLHAARLVDVPDVKAKGLLVLVNQLPEHGGIEVSAVNFSNQPIHETVRITPAAAHALGHDALDPKAPAIELDGEHRLRLDLAPYASRALVFKG